MALNRIAARNGNCDLVNDFYDFSFQLPAHARHSSSKTMQVSTHANGIQKIIAMASGPLRLPSLFLRSAKGSTREQCTCSGIFYLVWAACDACSPNPIDTTYRSSSVYRLPLTPVGGGMTIATRFLIVLVFLSSSFIAVYQVNQTTYSTF
jgi:hypothetical protein